MSFSKIFSVSVLLVVLLSSGCGALSSQVNHDSDTMLMPVLEHMVKNADKAGKVLRIVDLRSPQIEQLRQRCGAKYQIVSVYDSGQIQQDGVKNGSQEKVHIRTEILRVNGIWAEASGAYIHKLSDGFGSFASFRYKLRYKNGEWHIVSFEFIAAS